MWKLQSYGRLKQSGARSNSRSLRAVFEEHIEVGQPDIAAPHCFDFQIRNYVVAPETREDDTLVQLFRL